MLHVQLMSNKMRSAYCVSPDILEQELKKIIKVVSLLQNAIAKAQEQQEGCKRKKMISLKKEADNKKCKELMERNYRLTK